MTGLRGGIGVFFENILSLLPDPLRPVLPALPLYPARNYTAQRMLLFNIKQGSMSSKMLIFCNISVSD